MVSGGCGDITPRDATHVVVQNAWVPRAQGPVTTIESDTGAQTEAQVPLQTIACAFETKSRRRMKSIMIF